MANWKNTLWIPLAWGAAMACVIALIQAKGSLTIPSIIVLGIIGTLSFVLGAIGLKWHRAPHSIGTIPRLLVLLFFSAAIMGTVSWYVWPQPPFPHLHVTNIAFSVPDAPLGQASARITFENNGTAATKVRSAGAMTWYIDRANAEDRWAFEATLQKNGPKGIDNSLLGFDVPVGSDRSITLSSSPWEQSAIDRFIAGNGQVYAAGTVFYLANNGAVCKATYCMYTGKDGNGKFCLKHNEEPPCS